MFNSAKTSEKIDRLYSKKESRVQNRRIVKLKKKRFAFGIIITLMASIFAFITECGNDSERISKIERNAYEEGNRNVRLRVVYEGMGKSEDISLDVNSRKYSDEELEIFFAEIEGKIWDCIRGDNKSPDLISSDMNLVSRIDGYPFSVTYKTDQPLLINQKGVIDKKRLRECNEPQLVLLTMTLTYDDFKKDIQQYICLNNVIEKNYENFRDDVSDAIHRSDVESKAEDSQKLPQMVDGVKLSFYYAKSHAAIVILCMGIFVSVGLVVGVDKDVDKELERRNSQMISDYPQLLNQYALYYLAGMSHTKIWEKICERYKAKRDCNEIDKRYAYEEMILTLKEIEDGMGQLQAFENFSRRCHLVNYRAFINLIEQSVKKGDSSFSTALDDEVAKANREALSKVRMNAQEMSTKLLAPMIMMLVVVLVIVMVPAFISFNE